MENPVKMDENWGYPHDLGNLHTGDSSKIVIESDRIESGIVVIELLYILEWDVHPHSEPATHVFQGSHSRIFA